MKLAGYRSPGRRESRDKLRAIARPTAVNCPDIFAEDKEFMRLFWASKRIEGDPRQAEKFASLVSRLRARGLFLEQQSKDKEKAACLT